MKKIPAILFTGKRLYHNGKQYATPGGFVPEMCELREHFTSLTVCAPVSKKADLSCMDKFPEAIKISPLLPNRNYFTHFTVALYNFMKLFDILKEGAAIVCYVPSIEPIGATAAVLARVRRYPFLLCVRGSLVNTIRLYPKLGRFKKKLLLAEHSLIERITFAAAKQAPVYVAGRRNSEDLAKFGFNSLNWFHPVLHPLPDWTPAEHKQNGRILFVGRLERVKGTIDLLTAGERLCKSNIPVKIVFVGQECDGGETCYRATQLSKRYENFTVTFRGPLQYGPELFNEYASADILCLPSYSEGFPKVILEGMSSGAIVVAYDVGGVSELIENELNGFLVPAGDLERLTCVLRACFLDAQLRDRIRKAQRAASDLYRYASPYGIIAQHILQIMQ